MLNGQHFIDQQKVREIRDGVYVSDIRHLYANSGQEIQGGLVYTEHNPSFYPLEARGTFGQAGVFQGYSKNPAAQSRLQRRKKALASAPWRLQGARLPRHLKHDPQALRALLLQEEYCHRLWARWTRPAGRGRRLPTWIREVTMTAPVDGFFLGELRADQGVMAFSDGTIRAVYDFDLPYYRAPGSVLSWLFQGDQNVGVILQGAARSEYDGKIQGTTAVLPTTKYLVITRDIIGANVEGNSELRSVAQNVKLLWALQEIEAKAIDRHGSGELFFLHEEAKEMLSPTDTARLEGYLRDRAAGLKTNGLVTPIGIKPDILTPGTQMPEVTEPLARHWSSIFIGMGAEDRIMATEGGGSYAARSQAAEDSQAEDLDDARQLIAEPLEELMARAIRWSGLDFGREEFLFVPTVTTDPLHDRVSPQELTQALATAKEAGLLNDWSNEDEKAYRARLGL